MSQSKISAAADLVASSAGRHQHHTHDGHLLVIDEARATLSDGRGHKTPLSGAAAQKLGRVFDRMNHSQYMLDEIGRDPKFVEAVTGDTRRSIIRSVRHPRSSVSILQTPAATRYAPMTSAVIGAARQITDASTLRTMPIPTVAADVSEVGDSGVSCTDISSEISSLTPAYEAARATVEDLIVDANLSGASIALNPDGTLDVGGAGGYSELPSSLGDLVNIVQFEVAYSSMNEQLLQLNILATLYSTNGCWSQPSDPPPDPNQYGSAGASSSGDGGHDVTCYYLDWYDGDGNYLYTDDLGCYQSVE